MHVITSARDLKVGDVVQISVQLKDREDPTKTFWWKRFACVTDVSARFWFEALNLKLQIDLDKDLRKVDLRDGVNVRPQVVELLEESEIPQGPAAMRMKYIHLGLIKLGLT